MLRVALVGYDHVHLPKYEAAFARHPGARITHVVAGGANRDMARRDAARHGAVYGETLAALQQGQQPQAAYVGTPPDQHRAVAEALAAQGLHLLVDKPLATTLEDADAILRAAARHGVRLMVPFNPRHQRPVQRLKAMLDAGELGALQALHATKYGKIPRGIPGMDTAWFFDPGRAGFGGFGDIGIHAIDALRWLAGSEVARVHAQVGNIFHPGLAVDDAGTALLEFRNGVLASLQAGWANPAGNPTWLSVAFEALGTGGAALVDKPYQDFALAGPERAERVPWWRADVDGLVAEFVDAVELGRDPAPSGQDARAALEITLAAYRSAAAGQPVELPLGKA